MTLTFGYCDIPGFEYDATWAVDQHVINVFTMDIADLTPVSNIDAKRFEAELLDGQKWLLPRKHRLQQAFTTQPNLLLSGIQTALIGWDGTRVTRGPVATYTLQQLLTNWFYARSQWIVTPDVSDPAEKRYGFVKVIPAADKVGEKHEELGIMPKTTVTFETAGVY